MSNLRAPAFGVGHQLVDVHGIYAELRQRTILLGDRSLEAAMQVVGPEDVPHAQTKARSLVGVGWADATLGRPDLRPVGPMGFFKPVQTRMVGHHNMGAIRDHEVVGPHSGRLDLGQLLVQLVGVDHRPGPDDALGVGVEDARR